MQLNAISVIDLAFSLTEGLSDHDWYKYLLQELARHYGLSLLPIVQDQTEDSFFLGPDRKRRSKLAINLYFLRRGITDAADRWDWEELPNKYITIAQHEDRPELITQCRELWPQVNALNALGIASLPAVDELLLSTYGVEEEVIHREKVTLVELVGEAVGRAKVAEVHGLMTDVRKS